MFRFSVTGDSRYVLLELDDYTNKPQTWIIPGDAALQMSELLADAARLPVA